MVALPDHILTCPHCSLRTNLSLLLPRTALPSPRPDLPTSSGGYSQAAISVPGSLG